MVAPIQNSNFQNFSPPPKDLPLEFVLDFHLRENANYPIAIYPTEENGTGEYTYKEFVPAAHRIGRWILDAIDFCAASDVTPVIVVLLRTDTITSITLISGLMRSGVTVFPISPRFSATVIAYLLETSKPTAIIFDSLTQYLVESSIEEYTAKGSSRPVLCKLPSFSFLFPGHNAYEALPMYERRPEDISVMTHSSSSTSLYPKVISWSSSLMTHHGENQAFPARQLSGQILGGFGVEIFHSMGLVVLFTMLRQGLILGVMNPTESTSILPADPNDVFRCFELVKPSLFLTNPRALELWAEDPEKVAFLRDSEVELIFGGRFLSKTVGDKLVREGVKLRAGYGSTEAGPIALLPHFQGADWEYWTAPSGPGVKFISRDDGLFDLVVTAPDEKTPLPMTNTMLEGRLAYNSGDLFMAHPTKNHTFKMLGRSSDQIMLSTGEVVNPAEIETELSKHPLISSAIMFGHTRSAVGVIIEPTAIAHEKVMSKEVLIDGIWDIIDKFNQSSPSKNYISPKMIIVASSKKPISMSPKGLPRRPIVWHEYDDEISGVYAESLKSQL